MKTFFSPKNNPRVIIIQKLYGKFFNDEEKLDFPKHRFKKFIKDIVSGTIERNEILTEELDKNFGKDFNLNNLDKLFQVILKSATYEILYKHLKIKDFKFLIHCFTGSREFAFKLIELNHFLIL